MGQGDTVCIEEPVKSFLPLVSRVVLQEASSVYRRLEPFLAQEWSHRGGQEGSRNSPGRRAPGMKQTALQASLELGDEAAPGREQAGIDGAGSLERLGIDGDVDQRVEPTYRANVACLGSLDAQIFGLAIDALTTGALRIDGLVERAFPIEQGAHQAAFLPIGVFDAA